MGFEVGNPRRISRSIAQAFSNPDLFLRSLDRTCADLTHSTRDLGYSPQVPIEEGMKRLVDWYLRREAECDEGAGATDTEDEVEEEEEEEKTGTETDDTEAEIEASMASGERERDQKKGVPLSASDSGVSDSDDSGCDAEERR